MIVNIIGELLVFCCQEFPRFELSPCNKSDDLEVVCVLQVDAGSSGCINPDSHIQLQCFVLLLFCHRLLWIVVTDIPSQRPGLSQNTGRAHSAESDFLFWILLINNLGFKIHSVASELYSQSLCF